MVIHARILPTAGFAALLLGLAAMPCGAQAIPEPLPSNSPVIPGRSTGGLQPGNWAMGELQQRMARERNAIRQKEIVSDANRLLALARQIQADIGGTPAPAAGSGARKGDSATHSSQSPGAKSAPAGITPAKRTPAANGHAADVPLAAGGHAASITPAAAGASPRLTHADLAAAVEIERLAKIIREKMRDGQ